MARSQFGWKVSWCLLSNWIRHWLPPPLPPKKKAIQRTAGRRRFHIVGDSAAASDGGEIDGCRDEKGLIKDRSDIKWGNEKKKTPKNLPRKHETEEGGHGDANAARSGSREWRRQMEGAQWLKGHSSNEQVELWIFKYSTLTAFLLIITFSQKHAYDFFFFFIWWRATRSFEKPFRQLVVVDCTASCALSAGRVGQVSFTAMLKSCEEMPSASTHSKKPLLQSRPSHWQRAGTSCLQSTCMTSLPDSVQDKAALS